MPCLVQCAFVTSTGFIVTQLWMELQHGVIHDGVGQLSGGDMFQCLMQLIYRSDHGLISLLFTFNRLQQILSKEDEKSGEDEMDDKYPHTRTSTWCS